MNITNKTVMITGANRGIAGRSSMRHETGGEEGICGNAHGTRTRRPTRHAPGAGRDQPFAGRAAARDVDTLDVLINNAGIAIYDDLSHLA